MISYVPGISLLNKNLEYGEIAQIRIRLEDGADLDIAVVNGRLVAIFRQIYERCEGAGAWQGGRGGLRILAVLHGLTGLITLSQPPLPGTPNSCLAPQPQPPWPRC